MVTRSEMPFDMSPIRDCSPVLRRLSAGASFRMCVYHAVHGLRWNCLNNALVRHLGGYRASILIVASRSDFDPQPRPSLRRATRREHIPLHARRAGKKSEETAQGQCAGRCCGERSARSRIRDAQNESLAGRQQAAKKCTRSAGSRPVLRSHKTVLSETQSDPNQRF